MTSLPPHGDAEGDAEPRRPEGTPAPPPPGPPPGRYGVNPPPDFSAGSFPAPHAGRPCPRHPDREARMTCGRCGSPVCPACAQPAAVGVRCPECDRASVAPRARTVLGGVFTPGPPMVTYGLIAACVVVYLLQLVAPAVTTAGAFVPYLGERQPWRFLTAMFLHSQGQPLHIVFNMVALWQMGALLEPALGRARFAAMYLLAGLGGSVAYLLVASPPTSVLDLQDGSWFTGMIGASGAVFGLFGAALVSLRRLQQPIGGMLVLLAINAALPLLNPGIAWQAHAGGLVVGVIVAWLLILLADEPRRRAQWPALGGVAVVLVALAVAKYALVDTTFIDNLPLPY